MTRDAIVPTQKDIDAWRTQAEAFQKFGGVKLGEFDWPWVVLSLIQELEKSHAAWGECHDPR